MHFIIHLECLPLPPKEAKLGAKFLEEHYHKSLKESGYVFKSRNYFYSRGFSIYFSEISAEEKFKIIKGPKLNTPAVINFKDKHKDATFQEKDEYIYAKIFNPSLKELLEKDFKKLLRDIPFSKTMRWNSMEKFIRPMVGIYYEFSEILHLEYSGIRGEKINNYFTNFPFMDPVVRKEKLISQLPEIVSAPSDAYEEISTINNNAVPIIIDIPPRFHQMPLEIISYTLWKELFCLTFSDKDSLKTIFFSDNKEICVTKIAPTVHGRLMDAYFRFEEDKEKNFTVDDLKNVEFIHSSSYYDKINRVKDLWYQVLEKNQLNAIPHVIENYKLGILTETYTENHNFEFLVASCRVKNQNARDIIYQMYEIDVKGLLDNKNKLAVCLFVADKLDTIELLFKNNYKINSSSDPFGLKKAADKVLDLVLNYSLDIPSCFSEKTLEFLHHRMLLKEKLMFFKKQQDFSSQLSIFKQWFTEGGFPLARNLQERLKGLEKYHENITLNRDQTNILQKTGMDFIEALQNYLDNTRISGDASKEYFLHNCLNLMRNVFDFS